jgi:hypothetical protein
MKKNVNDLMEDELYLTVKEELRDIRGTLLCALTCIEKDHPYRAYADVRDMVQRLDNLIVDSRLDQIQEEVD